MQDISNRQVWGFLTPFTLVSQNIPTKQLTFLEMVTIVAKLLVTASVIIGATCQSNLPDVPSGVFTIATRIEINAPVQALWNATIDFAKYPNWNPFVRWV
jgi:hypothetical protein